MNFWEIVDSELEEISNIEREEDFERAFSRMEDLLYITLGRVHTLELGELGSGDIPTEPMMVYWGHDMDGEFYIKKRPLTEYEKKEWEKGIRKINQRRTTGS